MIEALWKCMLGGLLVKKLQRRLGIASYPKVRVPSHPISHHDILRAGWPSPNVCIQHSVQRSSHYRSRFGGTFINPEKSHVCHIEIWNHSWGWNPNLFDNRIMRYDGPLLSICFVRSLGGQIRYLVGWIPAFLAKYFSGWLNPTICCLVWVKS